MQHTPQSRAQAGTNYPSANDAAPVVARRQSPKVDNVGLHALAEVRGLSDTALGMTCAQLLVEAYFAKTLGPVGRARARGCPSSVERGVFLIQVGRAGRVAKIDSEDWPLVRHYAWNLTGDGHVQAKHYWGGGDAYVMSLHRLVMLLGKGSDSHVDHIDGNPLNNRKENLRLCTRAENMRNAKLSAANTSGFKGVQRYMGAWRGQVRVDGKTYVTPLHVDPSVANEWTIALRNKLHGEFARHV